MALYYIIKQKMKKKIKIGDKSIVADYFEVVALFHFKLLLIHFWKLSFEYDGNIRSIDYQQRFQDNISFSHTFVPIHMILRHFHQIFIFATTPPIENHIHDKKLFNTVLETCAKDPLLRIYCLVKEVYPNLNK